MKTNPRPFSFPPSDSPDVVGYRLYAEPAPGPITYAASERWDLGPETSGNLADYLGDHSGDFLLGVSALDAAGNESDIAITGPVALDFSPPNPPGPLSLG